MLIDKEKELIQEAMRDYEAYDGLDINDYKLIWTTETTDDFKANMTSGEIYRDEIDFNGLKADQIMGWQPFKGEPRKDIMIFDFGDHRIVVK